MLLLCLSLFYSCYIIQGPVTTKFRKGSCENCGAITHKKKDCLEVSSLHVSLNVQSLSIQYYTIIALK